MSEEYQYSAAIIMCTISEGRPSCSLHLLHQDWFYSSSTDPLMTLNGDALRNELNQWYNTARRKTLAFIWPQRVCLCERDYWESPALLMSSYELSWCLIIKTHYECFMSCGALVSVSCSFSTTAQSWSTNFTTVHTITYAACEYR